mmetsp:Transcript_50531/g.135160  ORF Transcript_50531/g.135160 Transcript_50531/m.135160 type:complete len:204 (+) Transcript_50531:387-998(+)
MGGPREVECVGVHLLLQPHEQVCARCEIRACPYQYRRWQEAYLVSARAQGRRCQLADCLRTLKVPEGADLPGPLDDGHAGRGDQAARPEGSLPDVRMGCVPFRHPAQVDGHRGAYRGRDLPLVGQERVGLSRRHGRAPASIVVPQAYNPQLLCARLPFCWVRFCIVPAVLPLHAGVAPRPARDQRASFRGGACTGRSAGIPHP